MPNLMKLLPLVAKLLFVDGRTFRHEEANRSTRKPRG